MASCTNRRMLIKIACALLAVASVAMVLRLLPTSGSHSSQDCSTEKLALVHVADRINPPRNPPVVVAADLPLPRVRVTNFTSTIVEDKFTIVMQSYMRNDLLQRLLSHYCKIKVIDRIIIVWNNVNVSVPDFLQNMACNRQLFYLEQHKNTIRNRFQPFSQIRTEGILSVDDDRLISEEDLTFAFSVWKKWKHLIVGWLPRVHVEIESSNGTEYHYRRSLVKNKNAKYSMILTGECFLHKSYLRLFNSTLPKSIQIMIDSMQSCEDIAMNVLVARYLANSGQPQCPGLLVNHRKTIQNLEKNTASRYKGLWRRPNDINTRHHCLNKLAEVFGDVFLRYSNIMVDSTSVYKHQAR